MLRAKKPLEQEGKNFKGAIEMRTITFVHRGNFKNTEKFFSKVMKQEYLDVLNKYGQLGVESLSAATPKDTGKTASSWTYTVDHDKSAVTIDWRNTNENKGVNIAYILQYGHGTGTGGYVAGVDYINPTMKPVFDAAEEETWKEVTSK